MGKCACGRGHKGHDVGKAPLTRRGVNDSSNRIRDVWDWWQRWPDANIAVDLDRSGLIAIAPDFPEWHERFLEYGLPDTAVLRPAGVPDITITTIADRKILP